MSTNISSYNSTIYTLLSSPWNFSKIDHILGHKASLNKYKKIEITPCILSDHSAIKLELYIAQQSVDHRKNKGGNQKVLGI
jgi:hypothetical protein